MTKTFEDYLNDPDLAGEPAALREVHVIRLMLHDETKDMTATEHTAYYNGGAAHFLAPEKPRAAAVQ